ncbi:MULTISPECIES: hypothetical protein [Dehalococcoides]|jgi:hypothetical protein|uniref:Uncharacterized protein n=1 Tax=Dehalococcoides mccartyi (strain VS) TaxID=311424 RepID=D2BHS3_DEHMV|nr:MULTISPECIES: hypothetical protein [Dehalococcoides]ACZ61873.1 hypothetical protein DhcVS_741 [Dehalococcoides mccartyi VS]AHB13531.1 hypothetical protein GY50_0751 [Dehalococcoides mccartyi GY50]AII57917.1 hypothetical protein X792_03900 [Dehalococcoides mccartyi CG1]APH12434.1 hypothetical protein ASJ33_04360 [Dehalococcoides mccartyi]QYY58046.1 hypothetical protein CWV2_001365 [Dehalococcoides mccartyi]
MTGGYIMGRGYTPETCIDEVKKALTGLGGRASAEEILLTVRKKGHWSDETVWQCMESNTINFPPACRHNTDTDSKFLFLREDGNYEFYAPKWHGRYERGKRIV